MWICRACAVLTFPARPPDHRGAAPRVARCCAAPRSRGKSSGSSASKTKSSPGAAAPWVWPLVVLATVSFVFIITNPFLWPSPIARSWLLFENRRDEMAQQQLDVPSRAVYGLDRRATLVWERSVFNDAFSPSRLGPPLEAILTVAGALWLAARVLVARVSGQRRAEMMVLLWLLCLWAGVTAGFGFLLQHYFVPTASIAILASGLAIGWAVQAAWNLAASLWQRSPSTPLPGERGQSGATPLLRA